jgi:hypothetical protein
MSFSGSYWKATKQIASTDNLTDFSFIIAELPSEFFTACTSTDGTKLRCSKDDGVTELAFDPIEFDTTTETIVLRVKWSGTITPTGTYTIRVYPALTGNVSYGVSDTYGQYNAYDSSNKGFYPVVGDSGTNLTDRTSNQEIGTLNYGVSIVDERLYFTTSTATVDIQSGKLLDGSSEFSVSFNINADSFSGDKRFVVFDSFAFNEPLIVWASSAVLEVLVTTSDSTTGIWKPGKTLNAGTDYKIDITYDGALLSVYSDSVLINTYAITGTLGVTGSTNYKLGYTTLGLNGEMWDVALRTKGLSSAFVLHEYSQTSDNSAFWGTWTEVTGQTGIELDADSGSITVSGQEISATVDRNILSETGSYVISGSDSGIILDKLLAANPGIITITGSDISLSITINKILDAETGSYNIVGEDVTISKDFKVLSESGSYIVSGSSVNIVYSGIVPVIVDVVILNGEISRNLTVYGTIIREQIISGVLE